MSCKSDVPYNYAQASDLDPYVYGAARPGAAGQRCFSTDDKVTPAEVLEWVEFMRGHGVTRVVSLLTESEVDTYLEPPLLALQQHFPHAVSVDIKAPGGVAQLVTQLEAAVAGQEKVVVHCWGGGGRTGLAIAAWLVRHHGLTPEAAAEKVARYAKAAGASRRADVAALTHLLQ